MKFEIQQEKFQEMLEKLMVKDIFPSSIISTKNGIMYSIQKAEKGRALRYVKFNNSYFKSIDDSTESIELDVEKALSLIKQVPSNTPLIVEKKENKLSVQRLITDDKGNPIGKKGYTMIGFKEPETVIKDSLPFEIKDGVPLVGDGKVPLSTSFTVNLSDLKDITAYGSSLKTEFYKFIFEKENEKLQLAVRTGGLHAFNDYDVMYPISEIKSGNELEVIFTYGLPQIAATYRQKDVVFKTSSNCPGFIYESCDTYMLGMLIPPYTPE
jgi:hypothetical protein